MATAVRIPVRGGQAEKPIGPTGAGTPYSIMPNKPNLRRPNGRSVPNHAKQTQFAEARRPSSTQSCQTNPICGGQTVALCPITPNEPNLPRPSGRPVPNHAKRTQSAEGRMSVILLSGKGL